MDPLKEEGNAALVYYCYLAQKFLQLAFLQISLAMKGQEVV
jgi:hypothetical protein